MRTRDDLIRGQKALSRFGELVLDTDDLQAILDEACRLIAHALGLDLAKVIEIERASNTGLVRAGVGWNPGIVGKERIDLSERSSEAYAIETSQPLVTQDIATEQRFHFPTFLVDHGVRAIVNVPIFLPGRHAWGILQVDAREPSAFDEEDIEFLKTYAMVLGPVIDRLETAAELGRTDERLRLVMSNARSYAIILSDVNDQITDWLAGSEEILGWSADEIVGQTTSELFTPEDREHGVPELELARAYQNGAAANVRWHLRKDGSRVFLDGQTIALRDPSTKITGFLKIAQDVTERHTAEGRQKLLLGELQHRVRNILAMVRSIARQSIESDADVNEFVAHLVGRLDAMARTQVLLTRATGAHVDLKGLIWTELESQLADPDRTKVEGPQVSLAPKAAEVLTLALHELATNSIKYGALSDPAGELTVSWGHSPMNGQEWLHLTWDERCKQVQPKPITPGFGTTLIEDRVPYELQGEASLHITAGGVRAEIAFPLIDGTSVLETGPDQAEEQ